MKACLGVSSHANVASGIKFILLFIYWCFLVWYTSHNTNRSTRTPTILPGSNRASTNSCGSFGRGLCRCRCFRRSCFSLRFRRLVGCSDERHETLEVNNALLVSSHNTRYLGHLFPVIEQRESQLANATESRSHSCTKSRAETTTAGGFDQPEYRNSKRLPDELTAANLEY